MKKAVCTVLEDYVVELMSAALHGRTASPKPEGITWERVYRLIARHTIQSLVFPALSPDMLADMPEQMARKWRHDAELALYRQVSFDIEREGILADFRRAGLSWLPLKGILVATYYPRPGMRSMGDQDIVFGYVDREENGGFVPRGETGEQRREWLNKADATVADIMNKHGFAEKSNHGREHSFMKGTLYFEMHRSMVSAAESTMGQSDAKEVAYYDNPWGLAKPSNGIPGEFLFDSEEEYIFHVSHMSKHYHGAGFGLRFLADEYLYCVKFPDAVRSEHVARTLKKLGLSELEQSVRGLSLTLFGDGTGRWCECASIAEKVLLEEIVSGGVYGSLEHRVAMRMAQENDKDLSLLRYWWRRLFPSKEWMQAYYPEWSRNGFTRFLSIFYRLYLSASQRPKQLRREIGLTLRKRKRR
ncbi:nucleotidyltransferase family protein [Bifidobacterium sp. MA2]|uniref:Nucleotidyltransferase family protein n=1 Tax=Bifidobacterium santillanense TaxID=2809028 RepID=A0ABS5UQD4_9BIFI|nr:nucleotidyltransferase family protein [Bifidobacterium santillanense]MBT1173152.1 nucleotidyltransferase family protein [Bifidobacterium santillanense]